MSAISRGIAEANGAGRMNGLRRDHIRISRIYTDQSPMRTERASGLS
jgi:hypothetical protein